MSKLYKKYVLLKIQNPNKIYIFECGIFYVFIHTDAEQMSKILDLKLTPLNSLISKCGFPISSADKYFNILKSLDYDFEIVPSGNFSPVGLSDYIEDKNYKLIIDNFLKINIDELSISEAFDYLHNLQTKFANIKADSNSWQPIFLYISIHIYLSLTSL